MQRLFLAVSAALLCGLLPIAAFGDGPEGPQLPRHHAPGDDNHVVRFILGEFGLNKTPITAFEDLEDDPADSALIILGNTEWLQNRALRDIFRGFVEKGGNVLIATSTNSAPIIEELLGGIRVVGTEVTTRDKDDGYRQFTDCPLVREFNRDYPMFQGIDALATNHPGYLERVQRRGGRGNFSSTAIAHFPESCQLPDRRTIPTFAMVCEQYNSRILVVSDNKVFINSMMLQQDNSNFAFAVKCARWLTEAEGRRPARTHVMLVDDGDPEPTFSVPIKSLDTVPPPPNMDDLPGHPVDILNTLIAKWEDENIHNELLLNGANSQRIARFVILALTTVLLAYGIYRIQQAHYRVETSP